MRVKFYIISLEERWGKFIPKAFQTLIENGINLEDVQVFKAFRGDEVPKNEYKLFENWNINSEVSWWDRDISLGEIGCAYSHFQLWKKIFFDNSDYFVILEEDFVLSENFKTEFKSLLDVIHNLNFDMFYLGRNRAYDFSEETLINEQLGIVSPNFSYCTHAYMLSQKGLIKLYLSDLLKNLIPLDEFMNCMFLKKHIREDLNKPLYNFQGQLKTLAFSNSLIGQSSNGNTEL